MTELQEARAKWLDAETRANAAEQRVADLMYENGELRMKLYVAEARAAASEAMHYGFVRGVLGLSL